MGMMGRRCDDAAEGDDPRFGDCITVSMGMGGVIVPSGLDVGALGVVGRDTGGVGGMSPVMFAKACTV